MATQTLNRRSELETFASFLNPIQKEIPKITTVSIPKLSKQERLGLHEHEGFTIGEHYYFVLFNVERIEDEEDFEIEIKEIARCHIMHGDEYVPMRQVELDLFRRIENICYDYFDRIMPEDFFTTSDTETWEQKGIYGNY